MAGGRAWEVAAAVYESITITAAQTIMGLFGTVIGVTSSVNNLSN